jgi:predicted NBD/HSP70 family sugar kinase
MLKPEPPSSLPRFIRQNNMVAALQALFDHGRLSRADLARHLGLNRSSSGNIIAELLATSLVREVPVVDHGAGNAPRSAGRPGIALELKPEAACFIGAEIGVEHITTLRMDLRGNVSDCRIEPFDGRSVPASLAVERAIAQAFAGVSDDILEIVEGFGLAVPAQIDQAGFVQIAPLLGWIAEDLQPLVRRALHTDLPVVIENEANAFAFGESYRDPDGKAGVTLFLVLESGVGGGIIIDGKLFRGGHGLAGEIGHVHVRDGTELEEVLGREHLESQYRKAVNRGDATVESFLTAVRNREREAMEIAEDWAADLAQAIVAACRLLDPNRVVLGGRLSALYPMVAGQVALHIEELQAATFPIPDIVVHQAAESGAAFGAACMLHRRFLSLENTALTKGA